MAHLHLKSHDAPLPIIVAGYKIPTNVKDIYIYVIYYIIFVDTKIPIHLEKLPLSSQWLLVVSTYFKHFESTETKRLEEQQAR